MPLTLMRSAYGNSPSQIRCKAMEHGFLAGRRDREDVPHPQFQHPGLGRAVERALDVDEARLRERAVSRGGAEAVEHGFLAGRREGENVPSLFAPSELVVP